MNFPRSNQQDAIIRLDIGFDTGVIRALFLKAWEKFTSIYGIDTPNQLDAQGFLEANACE